MPASSLLSDLRAVREFSYYYFTIFLDIIQGAFPTKTPLRAFDNLPTNAKGAVPSTAPFA